MSRDFSTGRRVLITGAVGVAGLALSGCDPIVKAPATRNFLKLGQTMSFAFQRAMLQGQRMAREFNEHDMSPVFRVNGSREATAPEYLALKATNFVDYRLIIDGLVHAPLALPLAQLRALAARTQITRHDCVEGWSAIGKWSGVPLHTLLGLAQVDCHAKFAVFHCFDTMPDGRGSVTPYYESIDMFDAFHPQTILAYDLNGAPLIEGHGAPLRLRVERQLGYKQAKFIKRITLVDRIDNIFRGNGGYWEDVAGYEWYGGI